MTRDDTDAPTGLMFLERRIADVTRVHVLPGRLGRLRAARVDDLRAALAARPACCT